MLLISIPAMVLPYTMPWMAANKTFMDSFPFLIASITTIAPKSKRRPLLLEGCPLLPASYFEETCISLFSSGECPLKQCMDLISFINCSEQVPCFQSECMGFSLVSNYSQAIKCILLVM